MIETEENMTTNATERREGWFTFGFHENRDKTKHLIIRQGAGEDEDVDLISIPESLIPELLRFVRDGGYDLNGSVAPNVQWPQPITRPSPKLRNSGMTWDKGEEAMLLHLDGIGAHQDEVSTCLGRPYAEILIKLAELDEEAERLTF